MNGAEQILLIGLGSDVAPDVIAPLRAAGYQVRLGTPTDITRQPWAAVISAPSAPGLGALELLAVLSGGVHGAPPLLVVGRAEDIVGLEVGSRVRTLRYPFESFELIRTIRALLHTPLPVDGTVSGGVAPIPGRLLSEGEFRERVSREIEARSAANSRVRSFVAFIQLHELGTYSRRLASTALDAVFRQQLDLAGFKSDATDHGRVILSTLGPERASLKSVAAEIYGKADDGALMMLLPGFTSRQVRGRMRELSDSITRHVFRLQGQQMTFTPIIGYARVSAQDSADSALANARDAAAQSASRLDLQPTFYRPAEADRGRGPPWSWLIRFIGAFEKRYRIWVQFAITMVFGIGFPFVVYCVLGSLGWDITHGVYLFVVIVLVLTALSIWVEGILALRPMHPPDEPATPYPSASAVIAAYLPNEAPIIESTIEAFLRVQYPAPLQVILAYNTPNDMAIEERLRQIAAAHPNFIPMRVLGSTSKAQNVNAALRSVTGEFTAVFDADHQPDPDSFRRAWRWLSHGADVVQGHCLIRNGDASWVARMIAVEFEQIYAVNHPGRARLHGFGIFGGSNGYWRTDLLRQLRMHGFMLTEDIDSSLRAVIGGRNIVSDPYLVSRELAPETLSALVNQRLRWAQGWFQISMKWALPALRSPQLNLQQKLGMLQLLVLREMFPWVSMQIVPLIAYWAVQAGSLWSVDLLVPIFVVTTLFTISTGPGQIVSTYRLADPQIKQRRCWFWFYLWTSTLFYSGMKNAWNRIAHIKEAMGESAWVVTTRASVKK